MGIRRRGWGGLRGTGEAGRVGMWRIGYEVLFFRGSGFWGLRFERERAGYGIRTWWDFDVYIIRFYTNSQLSQPLNQPEQIHSPLSLIPLQPRFFPTPQAKNSYQTTQPNPLLPLTLHTRSLPPLRKGNHTELPNPPLLHITRCFGDISRNPGLSNELSHISCQVFHTLTRICTYVWVDGWVSGWVSLTTLYGLYMVCER